jgi:hypothetical protein
VLAQLVDSRLVRTSERDAVDGSGVSETAFELAHDYLAERIELDPDIQSRKAAQELLNRELLNWQAVGALMDERTLAVVAAQREWLRMDRAAQALLLTSALANDIDLTPWLQTAPEDLARQVLLDGLASAEASQRARAIAALVGLADQSTAEVLAGVASADASVVVRDAAIVGLQQIDPQRARHELLAELAMPDPARRAQAATALRFDVDQDVAARLFTLTTQDDDQAVWQAALATLATSAAEPQRMGWQPLLKAQAPRQVATRRALRELGVVLPGRMEIRIWPARAKTYLRQEARSRPVWLAVRTVLATTLVFLLLAWWQSWPPFGVRWVRVAGSPQAEINTLEVAGERVYAGSLHYGVSRRDGDGAWSGWLNQGLPTGDPGPAGDPASIVETIRDLAVDSAQPDTVYALVDHHGLYMSADAGQSWAPIDIGIAITNTIGMAVAARDGVVLVAANDQGLFGSRDAGATWQQLSGQGTLPTGDYKVARYSPEGTPYVGGLNGLFRGTGQFPWTWERLEGLAPVWALDTGPNGRLYLAQGQGRPTAVVCFDPNQGQRIAGIFDDDAPIAVRASLEDPEMVYVGAVKRVYHLSCQAERTDPLLAVRLLIAELQGRDIVGTADLAWLDGGAGGYDLLQAKEDGIFAPAGSSR